MHPWYSSQKKDESLHLVQDYRKLNVMTVKTLPSALIQIISTVFQAKVKYFTSWMSDGDTTM